MTTRAQLESEREALIAIRRHMHVREVGQVADDALTASIARVEALLSLSDGQADLLADTLMTLEWGPGVDAYRTVADIVRRS